ncbi:acyl-CoA dehydrogenase family protein [Clavibacter michiganensis]|uniref:acyl-CoA dehydrogenase family protein n=1 Tax=Clavibacter michiganensis TaxID=28447 RepID=UPI0009BBE760|nr:acyl-CoA dehydrogenase family protein [Clavibacter michiganensis]AWF97047.1 acyl-CoA dehydrogenase [Clavibacter michiganensis subsp. insidiosus]AWG00115.1 acyl-CoA dehydrogenase [Clavibacter michiganensis subsp. insidiosus]OQJ58530.1 acyl-CoA dehydrogenase [Clavibacter michiganensis subsp. insidiosus]RII88557.1 acyl-CoA dehydrogenase [Clavibacter michiganensis subsp. insidiosus]RMC85165.1 acyl-CoA dehydrogenase [Clavibacter michiganensis subsp. insidiosus]
MTDTTTRSDAAPAPSPAPAAAADARSPWHGTASRDELARWRAVAERVAAALDEDALARDRANADPTTELDLLRDSGLLNLLDPAEHGGGGGHWESAFLAVRILSRTDASIAQVLAYHYINSGNLGFTATGATRAEGYRRTVAGRWVWGDSVNPTDPDLRLTPDGDGYRLNGLKRFSTGASAGDVVLVNAVVAGGDLDGRIVVFALDHDRPGIDYLGDWEALGQRLSASGSVRFADVRVDPADVLGLGGDEPFSTLVTPGIQLAFGNLYLGIAEGALAKALDLVRGRRGTWFLSPADAYRHDPFVQRVVGELASRIAAVEALADRAGRAFDEVVDLGDGVTAEVRGGIAIEVAKLKVVSTEVGVEVANRVFEVTGSSSARSSTGLDLFWRNVRTHSLHDPVDYKKLEVGAHALTGELQPISLYT